MTHLAVCKQGHEQPERVSGLWIKVMGKQDLAHEQCLSNPSAATSPRKREGRVLTSSEAVSECTAVKLSSSYL